MGIGVAAAIGLLTGAISRHEARRARPAGFGAGLIHGAAMPCMFPGLVLGHDTFIYATFNSGRPYKLGYTLGVNLCGAAFFGLLYRRGARPGLGTGPIGSADPASPAGSGTGATQYQAEQ
ncbi:MAG: hypothetical protein AB7O66_14110 [Limisphaerales bacterium]